MHFVRFGRTGYRVSSIGFGSWGLGGDLWRDTDPGESKKALTSAIDQGVNFIDTASIYGNGHSEEVIGQVVRDTGTRDSVVVATKIAPLNDEWPAVPHIPLSQVYPRDYVIKTVEQSLRKLKAEVLQIEQLHVWHDAWLDDTSWPELWGTMEQLITQGKVLHWGISVNDHAPETALRAMAQPIFRSVQVIYNIFDQSAEKELFPAATHNDVAVIARCPFDEGTLAGAIEPDTQFHPDEFRSMYFRGDRKAQAAQRADRLRSCLGDEAKTLPELALRFCLSNAVVNVTIPGMRRTRHVQSNLTACDGKRLSPGMLERLREHAWQKNWYE